VPGRRGNSSPLPAGVFYHFFPAGTGDNQGDPHAASLDLLVIVEGVDAVEPHLAETFINNPVPIRETRV
jgi:hypothetical protein